jgi:hypothetical protein
LALEARGNFFGGRFGFKDRAYIASKQAHDVEEVGRALVEIVKHGIGMSSGFDERVKSCEKEDKIENNLFLSRKFLVASLRQKPFQDR